MKIVYTVIVMLIMLFMITFSLENTSDVTLQYLHYRIAMQTYMLLFVTFLAGVIFAGFMGIVERFRLTRTINKLNKTIREVRRDLRANDTPSIIEDSQHRNLTETDP
ncbi:MAG: LapA family protein [Syntrophales bacterium]|nr:LapA family protein [Syntrophales bacterium]